MLYHLRGILGFLRALWDVRKDGRRRDDDEDEFGSDR